MTRRRRFWEPNPETIFEDLMLLADARRVSPKEGARRAAETLRRRRAERRAAALDKAVEAMEAGRAKRKRPAPGQRLVDRMLAAMEPEAWYGAGDMVRMIGAERSARSKVWQDMRRARLIERAPNPVYVPNVIFEAAEPKWLWRLTTKGIERRRANTGARQVSDSSE